MDREKLKRRIYAGERDFSGVDWSGAPLYNLGKQRNTVKTIRNSHSCYAPLRREQLRFVTHSHLARLRINSESSSL
jgi:hypothetical protein